MKRGATETAKSIGPLKKCCAVSVPNPSANNAPWRPDEDRAIRYFGDKNGGMNWDKFVEDAQGYEGKANMKCNLLPCADRTAEQCRDRWSAMTLREPGRVGARVAHSYAAGPGAGQIAPPVEQWFYNGSTTGRADGSDAAPLWKPFSEGHHHELEHAWYCKEPTCEIHREGTKYKVDMQTWLQSNEDTGYKRCVYRGKFPPQTENEWINHAAQCKDPKCQRTFDTLMGPDLPAAIKAAAFAAGNEARSEAGGDSGVCVMSRKTCKQGKTELCILHATEVVDLTAEDYEHRPSTVTRLAAATNVNLSTEITTCASVSAPERTDSGTVGNASADRNSWADGSKRSSQAPLVSSSFFKRGSVIIDGAGCSFAFMRASDNCIVRDMPPEHREFQHAESMIQKTLPGVAVQRVQRIENRRQYRRYEVEKMNMAEQLVELGEDGTVPEHTQFLFHGTRSTAPHTLFRRGGDGATVTVAQSGLLRSATCDGLDTRYSNPRGFYGSGLYFSDSASYCDRYAFRTAQDPHVRQLLLCAVLTGRCKNYEEDRHHDLRRAPPGYHSVTASAHSHDSLGSHSRMWVVYSNSQVYTAYILTYSV